MSGVLRGLGAPSHAGAAIWTALALTPPVVVAVLAGGAERLTLLATYLVVALAWEAFLARARGERPTAHALPTALILAVASPQVPLWQAALAVSFGVVLAEQVFGGRGFGVVGPAVATLAFLVFSFPGTAPEGTGPAVAWASLPGALLLLATGLGSIHVLVSGLAALTLGAAIQGTDPVAVAQAAAFGLVFLLADPFAAAVTTLGRWLYGAVFAWAFWAPGGLDGAPGAAIAFAALLAQISAPLADHAALTLRRARRGPA